MTTDTPLFPGAVPAAPATTYGPMDTHDLGAIALVLHTTEGARLPSYRDGAVAPHYSYEPGTGTWHRHAEVEDGYVGTMRGHATAGHANCKAIQVELVGFSSYPASLVRDRPDLWVGHLGDHHLAELARFYRWVMDRYGVLDELHARPRGQSWRYGTDSPYRLSDGAWATFSGLTAHGGVPRQTHWDTGVLDLHTVHEIATGGILMLRDLITDATWKAYAAAVGKAFGNWRYYATNDGTVKFSPPWGEGADDGGADREPGARENAYNVAQQALARKG